MSIVSQVIYQVHHDKQTVVTTGQSFSIHFAHFNFSTVQKEFVVLVVFSVPVQWWNWFSVLLDSL